MKNWCVLFVSLVCRLRWSEFVCQVNYHGGWMKCVWKEIGWAKRKLSRAHHTRRFFLSNCLFLSLTRFESNWMDNNNWHIKWLCQILISFRLLEMDRSEGLKLTMKMFYFSPFDSSASAPKTRYARIQCVCVCIQCFLFWIMIAQKDRPHGRCVVCDLYIDYVEPLYRLTCLQNRVVLLYALLLFFLSIDLFRCRGTSFLLCTVCALSFVSRNCWCRLLWSYYKHVLRNVTVIHGEKNLSLHRSSGLNGECAVRFAHMAALWLAAINRANDILKHIPRPSLYWHQPNPPNDAD